jgi:hypothetical protein
MRWGSMGPFYRLTTILVSLLLLFYHALVSDRLDFFQHSTLENLPVAFIPLGVKAKVFT